MTLSQSRLIRAVAVSACLIATGLVGAQPSSAATKTYACADVPVNKTPAGLNGGYFTKIRVTGSYTKKSSACKAGNSLVFAYYRCRRAKGVKGSCNGRTIQGLKCRESNRRVEEAANSLDADVTCTKGSKRIKHHYQQGLSS